MFTIAHLGDLHLDRRWLTAVGENGVNQREQDVYDALALVGADLVRRRPDLVVIAGDLFDSMKPSTRARGEAFRFVSGLRRAGLPVLIISGNHDHAKTSALSPLVHLGEFFDCQLATGQTHFDFGDLRVHCLPFPAIADACEGRAPLRPLQFTDAGTDVLVAHAYAHGTNVASPPETVLVPAPLLEDPRIALSMLGHIHQHVCLEEGGNAFYCGPLERLNWGEQTLEPSYWLHRVGEGRLQGSESVRVASLGDPALPRPFRLIRVQQADRTVDEVNRLVRSRLGEGLEGAVVRIVVTDCDEQLRTSALPRTWQEEVRKRGGLSCDLSLKSVASEHVLDVELADPPTRLDEALRSFLSKAKRDDLTADALRALGEASRG